MTVRRVFTSILLSPWFVTFVVLQVTALVLVAFVREPIDPFVEWVYLLSVLPGAALWFLLNLARDAARGKGRYVVAVLIAPLPALLLFANVHIYREFGEFASASMLRFLVLSKALDGFVGDYLWSASGLLALVGWLAWAVLWGFGHAVPIRAGRPRRMAALLAGLTLGASLAVSVAVTPHHRLSPETSVLTALVRLHTIDWGEQWRSPKRQPLPALESEQELPNVVLIVNESWSHSGGPFDGYEEGAMPFLRGWMEREPEAFVAFERAYVLTTATRLSLPTLFTGVPPHESVEMYHHMPLLWQWAQAAGIEPFMVSPKPMKAFRFSEFFELHALRHYQLGTRTPHAADELSEIDEVAAADAFGRILEQLPRERPFFGIYTSDAAHEPMVTESPYLDRQPDFEDDYANALYIVDASIRRIVEAVERAGELENTIFVLTADHGSHQARKHLPPRAYSVYEEFSNVPLLVRVPKRWQERLGPEMGTLRANVRKNVSYTDIVATLVDLWGFEDSEPHQAIVRQIPALSLFEPVPDDRVLILLNNNAIRYWEHRVFGIFWKDMRFLFSTIEGARLYDLSTDPGQRRNLWEQAPAPMRRKVLENVEEHPPLHDIWQRYAEPET